jgi:hypothetical protein
VGGIKGGQFFQRREKSVGQVWLHVKNSLLAIEVKSKISDPAPENLTKFRARFPGSKTLLIGNSGLLWQDFLATEDLRELL